MTITLRLVLAPEARTVTLDNNATLQYLKLTIQNSFGLSLSSSSIIISFGHPPKTMDLGNHDDDMKKLTAVGIQHQDRIRIQETNVVKQKKTSEKKPAAAIAAAAAAATSGSNDGNRSSSNNNNDNTMIIIPGLTQNHYIKASKQSVSVVPKLVRSTNTATAFHLRWKATGSRGETYNLEAHGGITSKYTSNNHNNHNNNNNNVNNLKVHCTCPAFERRGEDVTRGQVRVCKHLQAALDSVVAPTAAVDAAAAAAAAAAAVNDNNEKKRPADCASNSSTGPRRVKKKRRHMDEADRAVTEAPIYLFTTQEDLAQRQHSSSGDSSCYTKCKTLAEIAFGDDDHQRHHHYNGIQWMVVSNFLISFDYLKTALPQLATVPRLVVFYDGRRQQGQQGPPPPGWPRNGHASVANQVVDLVALNPGADPLTTSNPNKYRFQFGCHHTKLFLVGWQDKIRVVVSTCNLDGGDTTKANAAYVEEFPIKSETERMTTTSDFEDDMVRYLQSYGYTTRRNWMGSASGGDKSHQRETLLETVRRYDFSQAKVVLIPSVPGYHNVDDRTPPSGQLKLRQAIREFTTTPSDASQQRPVVCQFSSIGSLSEKYLQTLQTSMDTYLAKTSQASDKLLLKFVYPSVEEIRTSIEGYAGGGSVPGSRNNVNKPLLKSLWYKWAGGSGSRGGDGNPLTKPRHVPHIKSYYQIDHTGQGFDWLCITSHNISQSAWGSIRDNKNYGGRHLYIPSWELGVFLSPHTLGVDRLVPWRGTNVAAGGRKLGSASSSSSSLTSSDGETATKVATVAMPFATHALVPYGFHDQPWAWDETYPLPDAYGRRGLGK